MNLANKVHPQSIETTYSRSKYTVKWKNTSTIKVVVFVCMVLYFGFVALMFKLLYSVIHSLACSVSLSHTHTHAHTHCDCMFIV